MHARDVTAVWGAAAYVVATTTLAYVREHVREHVREPAARLRAAWIMMPNTERAQLGAMVAMIGVEWIVGQIQHKKGAGEGEGEGK